MRVSQEEFDQYVEQAIAGVDEQFRKYLDEVPVVVEDWPRDAVRARMGLAGPENLLGLFQGVPLKLQGAATAGGPNQITLFRETIMRTCRTREELVERIRRVLVHELGHYLGFSEGHLRARGY